uniref:Uncharacterized protein n=1 Tax=Oryza punctata TaxID=4537 RepID=A0A0E0KRK6_ORYPU
MLRVSQRWWDEEDGRIWLLQVQIWRVLRLGCGWAPGGGDDDEAARRCSGDLCGPPVALSVRLSRSVESGHCARDSKVKALFRLWVLATATPSGVVHLFEGVAIGALVQLHIKGPGENLRFVTIGRCRRSVGVTFLKASF